MTDATSAPAERDAAPTESASDDGLSYQVPPGAETFDCPYCGRPFARESWRALHCGLEHPGSLDDEEIESFRAAHEAEEDALATFRLQALGALILLYFGLLMVYALV